MEQMKTLTVNGEPYEIVDAQARSLTESMIPSVQETCETVKTIEAYFSVEGHLRKGFDAVIDEMKLHNKDADSMLMWLADQFSADTAPELAQQKGIIYSLYAGVCNAEQIICDVLVTAEENKAALANMDAALEGILAIQNTLIGGERA